MKAESRLFQVRTLWALLAGMAALLLAGRFLLQDRCIGVILLALDHGSRVGWAVLVLAAALSAGAALLRVLRLRPAGNGAAALFAVGVGLAVISTLTLLLGTIGFGGKPRYLVVLLALLALGVRDLGVLLRAAPPALRRLRRASWLQIALWGVMGFFLLLSLTRAFEPPWEYDDLEYHLAAPAAYHAAERVHFLRDNAYANFPQNMEMLDLLGMDLTGSPDSGAVVGQLLGAALAFLTALALREMLRGLARRPAGDLAAAIFYAWPGVVWYSGLAHVEMPLTFYGVLALWGVLWSWRRRIERPRARGWVLLAGIAAGAAMGVKYTAALLVFVPLLFWLIALGLVRRVPVKTLLQRVALYVGVAILCFSPWLIRNAVDTGNPVYPLLYKVFDGTNWDARKDARWTQAHSPKELSAAHFAAQAYEALFVDGEEHNELASLLFLAPLPFILLVGRWTRAPAWVLLAHAALLYVLWFFFTQQNVRFYEVAFPALAAVAAMGLRALRAERVIPGVGAAVVILLLLQPACWISYAHVHRSLPVALGLVSPEEYRARSPQYNPRYAAMQFVNDEKNLPAGSRVLFLGEARVFDCRRPYLASTVFDTNRLEEAVGAAQTPDELLAALQRLGVTHLYVDTGELRRLQSSYRYTFEGRECWGMLDGFNWPLFAQFARAHLRAVYTYPAGAPVGQFPWEQWPEILRQADAGAKGGSFIAVYEVR